MSFTKVNRNITFCLFNRNLVDNKITKVSPGSFHGLLKLDSL